MREALAAAGHDFLVSGPRPSRARRGGGRKKSSPRGAGRAKKRAAAIALGLVCVGALAGILVNALALQKTRHPAPLFAKAAPERPAPVAVAPAPLPAPRPQPVVAAREAEEPRAEARPEEKKPEEKRAKPPAASEAPAHDPISDLIRTGAPPRETSPAREAAAPAVSKTVMAAQKALVKLGFVLKADGVMGASTRQAIERFERDRGRKSNGDLTGAAARALSAESGVAIE
ncbi:peptidoglycan-binding protein [Methylocella sp.]|uniref:peptidoglycan-binding domain-containing protein n=1 Tax=Methylocella sp. TaxID=1978226 RepID=UPI0035AD90BF